MPKNPSRLTRLQLPEAVRVLPLIEGAQEIERSPHSDVEGFPIFHWFHFDDPVGPDLPQGL
jgi:hypothetical protein